MEKMRTAVSQNDSAALRLTAHSLKSNAADFGAMILAGQCQELESMGKSENLNGAFEILTEAEGEFAQVQSALLAMLKEETLAG
jgi:HPt (histidine-containing phosphotransfer) domain-containing protein